MHSHHLVLFHRQLLRIFSILLGDVIIVSLHGVSSRCVAGASGEVTRLMESKSHLLVFSIDEARVSDAGSYRCRANNSEGVSQVVYELHVEC